MNLLSLIYRSTSLRVHVDRTNEVYRVELEQLAVIAAGMVRFNERRLKGNVLLHM